MKVNIKRLTKKAVVPFYSREGDAALDIVATSRDTKANQVIYGTDLAIEIPEGHVGLLYPRSSISRYDLYLSNSTGVIDSNYRGEIKFIFNLKPDAYTVYNVGDRIGQLMIVPYPKIEFNEVESLNETDRGNKGFGSSGK